MPKYITFTVTPADGSPYEFWINAEAPGNTVSVYTQNDLNGDAVGGRPYSIFAGGFGTAAGGNGNVATYNLYAVPVGTPSRKLSEVLYPAQWYSKALSEVRLTNSDQIFVEIDDLPPAGISAISGTCPTPTTP